MSTENIRVQLTGKHPHAGEYGTVVAVDGLVTIDRPAGVSVDMVRVELENCPHGVAASYARRNELTIQRIVAPVARSHTANDALYGGE